MIYIKGTTDIEIAEDTALSIGKFDGLHEGHEFLLEALFQKKQQIGLKTAIFTFDMPPVKGLGKADCKVLTTNVERKNLFEELGIDYLVECPFVPEISTMEPEFFIRMLVDRLHVKFLVAGEDCSFGYQRKGNAQTLLDFSEKYGYEAQIVKKKKKAGRDISSTYVREEVAAGRMENARELLGYPYFVSGKVMHGKALGRTIGIPTINLMPGEEKLLPPFGVYAACAVFGEEKYTGIANVGIKPTVGKENRAGVEMHIFDFTENLYDKEVKIELLHFIRAERRFDSIEELKLQIQKDCETVRKMQPFHS